MLNTISGMLSGGVAATDFESIATTVVGSGGSSTITFSSIPATYTHLQVRASWLNSNNSNNWFRTNGDTGSNYAGHSLFGDGSTAQSGNYTSNNEGNLIAFSFTSTGETVAVIDILDYANTNKYKTTRTLAGQDTNGSGQIALRSSLWQNTAAITSLTFYSQTGTFSQYSSFALYGIK
jgi:hypothetical protein